MTKTEEIKMLQERIERNESRYAMLRERCYTEMQLDSVMLGYTQTTRPQIEADTNRLETLKAAKAV